MNTENKPSESFDFIRTYTQYADVLEAPREMHELVGIQLLATNLNINGVTIPHGSLTYPLDLWQVLLSGSGFGRSTLVGMADPIIKEAGLQEDTLNNFFRRETWGSSQGLMQQTDLHPSGLYVWGELSETLKLLNDSKFGGAKQWLTDRYDNFKIPSSITYRVTGNPEKDTPAIVFSQPPRINILATSSMEWFFNNLAQEDSAGGFLPRWMLFAVGDTGRIIPTPKFTNQSLIGPLANHLQKASQLKGEADLSEILRPHGSWYHETHRRFQSQPTKELAMAYFNRHRVHILKLAVIYEVSSSLSLKVSLPSWSRAVRTARKLEETIFRLLPTGMSGAGYLLQQMEDRIKKAGVAGLRLSEFNRAFQHADYRERNSGLPTLVQGERIHIFWRTTSGRPAQVLIHSDYLIEYRQNHPGETQR
jgi:hypothetical protein